MKLYYEKAELPAATTLSAATIEEEIRQERFPKPRQLAGRRVGWLVEEVQEWARSRPVSDQAPPPNTNARTPREVADAVLCAAGVPAGAAQSEALLKEAEDLIRTAWSAMLKMGLRDRGSDIGLPHEVRMFAMKFSEEGRDGPGELQIRGNARKTPPTPKGRGREVRPKPGGDVRFGQPAPALRTTMMFWTASAA